MSEHLLSDRDLDLIFREARTYNAWSDKPVTNVELQAIYDLMRMGPTSANCCPARLIFCQSDEARHKLAECASEGNKDKIKQAPVTVIIGHDMDFLDRLPQLFPHADAKSWFEGNDALIEETAFRNGTLQGAYLMMAARALGLDCGPMSGFDKDKVKEAFLKDTNIEPNFLCSIGHGTTENLFPRSPRLSFNEVCEIK